MPSERVTTGAAEVSDGGPEQFEHAIDIDRPNAARMYDYFLGGGHHFAADRALADQVIARDPDVVRAAGELRAFLRRTAICALDRGVDQFLDLGSGIPTAGNVHEIVRARNPNARVAYVDHDPVAVAHAGDILAAVEGVTVTRADIRDPAAILGAPTITSVIDFDRPVAVLMLAVLHFVSDADGAGDIVAGVRELMVPGSILVISHGSADYDDPEIISAMHARHALYQQSAHPTTLRTRSAIRGLFGDLELVEPGLVDVSRWRPDGAGSVGSDVGAYGGFGVRTGEETG